MHPLCTQFLSQFIYTLSFRKTDVSVSCHHTDTHFLNWKRYKLKHGCSFASFSFIYLHREKGNDLKEMKMRWGDENAKGFLPLSSCTGVSGPVGDSFAFQIFYNIWRKTTGYRYCVTTFRKTTWKKEIICIRDQKTWLDNDHAFPKTTLNVKVTLMSDRFNLTNNYSI